MASSRPSQSGQSPSSLRLTPSDVLRGKSPKMSANGSVVSPRSERVVTLVDEPETILPPPAEEDERPSSQKQHRASISGRKMTGRPPITHTSSSSSLAYQMSNFSLRPDSTDSLSPDASTKQGPDLKPVLSQVVDWLVAEKSKQFKRKMRHPHWNKRHDPVTVGGDVYTDRSKRDATEDDSDLALDKLEGILSGFMRSPWISTPKLTPKSPMLLARKGSIARILKRPSIPDLSSGTDWHGDEFLVPNVEADLDNTKTMSYTGGVTDADTSEKAKKKDRKHWVKFKEDILRLTHTLQLRGWRRVLMEEADEIDVARLSGALTNAVYVVKPPKQKHTSEGVGANGVPKKRPKALLLRIYGPQAGHLIDRKEELDILRRLCQKNIGPRMLGTFSNGRFEEFLHARTLEFQDLRIPETSKQIAKRMRELHDGIELQERELERGPEIFVKWEKCVERCEEVVSWLDAQVNVLERHDKNVEPLPQYTRYGYILGAEWKVFRRTYEKYREKLIKECGGTTELRKKLVFAHNDAQYGNLMRLTPSGESPLLQPSNHHKQLVVIDFEYAGPNTIGLEFANHFTEWCYNYHDPESSYACKTKYYPTEEEQYRFVRSYIMHRPQFNPAASSTPKMEARDKTNISDFMLDARAPPGAEKGDYEVEEKAREKKQEEDIQRLLHETRLWRIADSAHWVTWGIIQAKVPELDESKKKSKTSKLLEVLKENFHPQSDPLDEEEKQLADDAKHDRPEGKPFEDVHTDGEEEEDSEFDNLAYAQERAMFFWGDCLQMGLIKEEELPEKTRKMAKIVPY